MNRNPNVGPFSVIFDNGRKACEATESGLDNR